MIVFIRAFQGHLYQFFNLTDLAVETGKLTKVIITIPSFHLITKAKMADLIRGARQPYLVPTTLGSLKAM